MHTLWGNIKILILNWFGETILKYLPKSHFLTKKFPQYWGIFFTTLQLPWYWGISPVLGEMKQSMPVHVTRISEKSAMTY